MKHHTTDIELATTEHLQFIDITDRVRAIVASSGIRRGIVNIYTRHTTSAVKINERCDHLQQDMCMFLDAVAPRGKGYRHDRAALDGRDNAHSHLMSLMLGASESIPVADGELAMGTWQSLFFIELDGPRGERAATVCVMGE